jgi:hypothetical protein
MRNIILFFLIIFASCSKDLNKVPTQKFFFYSNASDQSVAPIQGVRTTCDVIKFNGNERKVVSIIIHTDNGYIVQWGYQRSNGATLPVLNVAKNDNEPGLTSTLLYPPSLIFGQKQTFSIYNIIGTTKWRVAIDGTDNYELELSTQFGSGAKVSVETGPVDGIGRFTIINFYPALETYFNGSWHPVQSAYASKADFGMEGQLQNSIRFNELNIGTGINIISVGSILWNNN